MTFSQRLSSEFIGTFALIFVGVSSICVNAGLVGVALAHGLAIAVMISSMGYISGGFFNPAVTVGAWYGGHISSRDMFAYIIVQLAGGFTGALAVQAIFPTETWQAVSLGTPSLAPTIGVAPGILMEIILTFFLVLVVYGTAIDSRSPKLGGLFIGLTITLDILAGGPITGASMNPARTFGPALAGGYWDHHFVYWIGPLLGGALAGIIHRHLLGKLPESR
jgi:MIP family channel proteins